MKKCLWLFIAIWLLVTPAAGYVQAADMGIFQVSTINALLVGVYDGSETISDLSQQGDFGIGTFAALDGEMVALDGKFYQVLANGKVQEVTGNTATPFAAVTFFKADTTQELSSVGSYEELQRELNKNILKPNHFYAFRVDAEFEYVKTRSVPKQDKPYLPLAEVTKNQPTFEYQNIKGTLVGFWSPSFVQGINVPGYHLHFISDDRKAGGHLLECRLKAGTVKVERIADFRMKLPDNAAFNQAELGKNRAQELAKAEK